MYSLPLDIQLSRGGWNPINQFNPATSNSNTQFDNATIQMSLIHVKININY